MKLKSIIYGMALAAILHSCKRAELNGPMINTGNFIDTSGTLKEHADFPIGFAIEYPAAMAGGQYFSVVKREGTSITFGNELKNSSIVKADGSYDFSTADAFYNMATQAGLEVFGHTLVWHSQQRASYYNSLIGGGSGGNAAPNLVVNGGFETAATNGDVADGWQAVNGASQFSIAAASNANSGGKALQANVPAGGQNWNTQIITRMPIPVTAGKKYMISFYAKGASAQSIQFEVRPGGGSVDYQGGRAITTNYAKISYEYTVPAGATTLQIAFDLGGTANTIYIDDVSIVETNYTPPPSNLLPNGGFETAATNGDVASDWQALNGASQFTIAAASNANSGSKALQANVPAGGSSWNTQIANRAAVPVEGGKKYNISFYAKGASPQNIQFEVRPGGGSVDYQGGRAITTNYAKISYEYTVPAGATTLQVAFDLGGTANTIYIDDVVIAEASVVQPPSTEELKPIVDAEMKKHIETVVNHYAGKIKAWDVLNEPFAEDGTLRDNANTNTPVINDVFVWQHYLGRDYAAKAFQYAHAADPSAELYINDYNLERPGLVKLSAFVALANELKAANTGITGVGTQMHIEVGTADYGAIAKHFQMLASTGLKVRISELDVRINSVNNSFRAGFTPSELNYRLQAAMYKYVIDMYFKYVPAAQRGGITIWGVHDPDSWFNTPARNSDNIYEYPLLFDGNYTKKQAYAAVKEALKNNRGE